MKTRKSFLNSPGGLALLALWVWLTVTQNASAADAKSPPTPPAADFEPLLKAAAAKPAAPLAGEGWTSLFNGHDLAGWKVTTFYSHGKVRCDSGLLVLEEGNDLTGVTWTNPVIKMNYEVSLEAMRVDGSDFFCALTLPVGDDFCSLILGGWGGTMIGISSIDDRNASENETSDTMDFTSGRWYRVRMRVTPEKIEAWLDDKQIVNLKTAGHDITVRAGEIEFSKPFGLASYATTAALREIKIRKLDAAPADKK